MPQTKTLYVIRPHMLRECQHTITGDLLWKGDLPSSQSNDPSDKLKNPTMMVVALNSIGDEWAPLSCRYNLIPGPPTLRSLSFSRARTDWWCYYMASQGRTANNQNTFNFVCWLFHRATTERNEVRWASIIGILSYSYLLGKKGTACWVLLGLFLLHLCFLNNWKPAVS